MSNHVETQCQHCGQTDDHPKSHWNTGESFHLDCLPFDKRTQLIESSEHGKALVEAALAGKHGEDLRSFSAQLHGEAS